MNFNGKYVSSESHCQKTVKIFVELQINMYLNGTFHYISTVYRKITESLSDRLYSYNMTLILILTIYVIIQWYIC